MKFIDFLKIMDSTVNVKIWFKEFCGDEPEFEGILADIPWFIAYNYEIDTEANDGEPIWFYTEKNQHGVVFPIMVINLKKCGR